MVEARGLDLHERLAASKRGDILTADFNHVRTTGAHSLGDNTALRSKRLHVDIM
jgi:hypothetical protein